MTLARQITYTVMVQAVFAVGMLWIKGLPGLLCLFGMVILGLRLGVVISERVSKLETRMAEPDITTPAGTPTPTNT